MKTIKKNVYYCDHCKKKSLAAHAMKVHEKHCTANPNRECRVCDNKFINEAIDEFKLRFEFTDQPETDCITGEPTGRREVRASWTGEPVTLKEIRDRADNCPACILAILRQTDFFQGMVDTGKFDFKTELAEAMKDKYAERPGSEYYG